MRARFPIAAVGALLALPLACAQAQSSSASGASGTSASAGSTPAAQAPMTAPTQQALPGSSTPSNSSLRTNPIATDPAATPAEMSAIAPAGSASQPSAGIAANNFSVLDSNADGMLSSAEVSGVPQLGAEFASADSNHDGQLSRSEWARWQGQQAGAAAVAQAPAGEVAAPQAGAVPRAAIGTAAADPRFAEVDRNRDGLVSRDEISIQPTLSERFAEFDLNGDGVLSQREFATLLRETPGSGTPVRRR